MHIVTKVLVVFAAVLCVLLAALTMAYSVNTDRLLTDFKNARASAISANDLASRQVAESNERVQAFQNTLATLQAELASRDGAIRDLQGERSRLTSEKRAAEDARASIEQKIDQLAATGATQAGLIESYSKETTALRENELSLRKREIELTDRLSDVESQREVLDQTVRALQEQLAEARLALEQSRGTGIGGTPGPGVVWVAVRGRVLKVETDPATGKLLATINVGTNDQVKERMVLNLSRGEQFLGKLEIIKTDLQWAIGRVDTLGRQGITIQPNDLVTSGFQQ